MKPVNVALLALAGMVLTSVSVYSLTPSPSARPAPAGGEAAADVAAAVDPVAQDRSRFRDGKTVTVEGRAGHARLRKGGGGETFLLLEVRGEGEEGARAPAPANLSLVIDRSGSMAGTRMKNAINGALGAVDRLNDGDVVSVVVFDTKTSVVVPPTTISPGTRPLIARDIRKIALGGDTCISCGIEEGLALLDRTVGRTNKMILLSDGDANNGIKDELGFRALARRARDRGAAVTTIGVDVNYNERFLTAIAQESNGQHYFVENDASLARIFEAEAAATTATIASGAEASIELAPGTTLIQVFDRSFRRSEGRIVVPLGTFTRGEVKTVLAKVRVPDGVEGEAAIEGPANAESRLTMIARVELTYRDLIEDREARCAGKLAVEVTADPAKATPLDGVVAGRVSRSGTGAALREANALFEKGRVAEARQRLNEQARSLRAASPDALAAAPADRRDDVGRDFDKQLDDITSAEKSFATPAPAGGAPVHVSHHGRAAVRKNAKKFFAAGL